MRNFDRLNTVRSWKKQKLKFSVSPEWWTSFFFSFDRKKRLYELEANRGILLKQREETLCQKSRAIWLKLGDNNSKCFHRFANQRRITNTVWVINYDEGEVCSDQSSIRKVVVDHFNAQFDHPVV